MLLRSRGLALRVIEDHKLLNDPEFYPPGIAGKTKEEIRQIKEGMAGGLSGGIDSHAGPQHVAGRDLLHRHLAAARAEDRRGLGRLVHAMNVAKKLESVHAGQRVPQPADRRVQADLEVSRKELQDYGQQQRHRLRRRRTGNVHDAEAQRS